jgi:two-component system NtrC family sensor kinase
LVAGIAHEVNNPLAFISSHLSTIASSLQDFYGRIHGVDPDAKQRWDRALLRLGQASSGVERIRDLVLKLQTFSRIDQGERKRVRVAECVESVLTIVRHRTKGMTLSVDVTESDEIECFPSLLNQALMNLVTNAIDAVESHGEVLVHGVRAGNEYLLSVSDDGPGIPDGIRDRIIEPFFTTKEVGKGTGLGLSITFSIIEKHRGSLTFTERPGGGTTATIRIPDDA